MKSDGKIYIFITKSCPACLRLLELFKNRKDINFVEKLKIETKLSPDMEFAVPFPYSKVDGKIIPLNLEKILELEKNNKINEYYNQ